MKHFFQATYPKGEGIHGVAADVQLEVAVAADVWLPEVVEADDVQLKEITAVQAQKVQRSHGHRVDNFAEIGNRLQEVVADVQL